jgi:hypothetical protein
VLGTIAVHDPPLAIAGSVGAGFATPTSPIRIGIRVQASNPAHLPHTTSSAAHMKSVFRSVAIGSTAGTGGCVMVVEKLRHHEIFGLLTPKEVDGLSTASGVVKLAKGERAYSEGGQRLTCLFFLGGR